MNLFVAALSFVTLCNADVYMHNPRGSNDRNCERNVNRNNDNRLFDSQNNAAGGYACPRAVGDEDMQNEAAEATFYDVDSSGADDGTTFVQSKRMYYYEGSVLAIEWTNQHGCGLNAKLECELVLQYACEDTLDPRVDNFWPWVTNKAGTDSTYYGTQHFRSGTNIGAPRDGIPRDSDDAATDTIPNQESSAIASTEETRRFGMHENFDYYTLCSQTKRNNGLYTADQWMRRNDRRATRQNPNGNRFGFECPEERDYYPWWAPSPWIDIAVLTDDASNKPCFYSNMTYCTKRCQYYINNTMNFNKKGYCDVPHDGSRSLNDKLNSNAWRGNQWYDTKSSCEAAGFTWFMISHSDNLNIDKDSFVCAKTQFSRVNQLGNAHADDTVESQSMIGVLADHAVHGVNANRFLWSIPSIPTNKSKTYFNAGMESAYKSCTLRLRYNVSTGDFQQWPTDANNPGSGRMVDWANNSKSSSDTNTPLLQDPYIYIGPGDTKGKADKFVSLAVNTNQYGRTFQDRSYTFSIRKIPDSDSEMSTQTDSPRVQANAMKAKIAAGGKIYNVNVRGKRGNIVQVYPSVEYDFVPNALALGENDMVHFQWTGSDYNPRRGCNNGEGGPPDLNTYVDSTNAGLNSRADRSNVMVLDYMSMNTPSDYAGYDQDDTDMTYTQKVTASTSSILSVAPCYNPAEDDDSDDNAACYETMVRLAYLNQQMDGGSLVLRQGKPCLTQDELDAYLNQEEAENHPLNCAKLNAKPYPYFDGGVMFFNANRQGKFAYYSTRNNNFSNRNQAGIICVGDDCTTDPLTGVLQDTNPMWSGNEVPPRPARVSASACYDTANSDEGANNNGAQSCIPDSTDEADQMLEGDTYTRAEADNNNMGDGDQQGCEILTFSNLKDSVEKQIVLAIILLFVGLFTAWLAYFLYNRYQLKYGKKGEEGSHRYDAAWTGKGGNFEMSGGNKNKEIIEKEMI